MEKIRRRSLLELCFVALFIGNCLLIIVSIFEEGFFFTGAAIIFSVIQIAIFRQFQKKADRGKKFSLQGMLKDLWQVCFLDVRRKSHEPTFGVSAKRLVRKRALGLASNPLFQKFSQEGTWYGYIDQQRRGKGFLDWNLKVNVGSDQCLQPYSLHVLNSATQDLYTVHDVYMLSEAAKLSGFALATGIKGLQPEHIRGGGDLIWQFQLSFPALKSFGESEESIFYRRNSCRPYIKMIEFSIKGTEKYQYGMWIDEHNRVSFQKDYGRWENNQNDLSEILHCLSLLRELSGKKPVGIRLFFSKEEEITALCQAIRQTAISPDFITIDEQSGFSILTATKQKLEYFKISSVLLYSGSVVSELDILKAMTLGASACISTAPIVKALTQVWPSSPGSGWNKSKQLSNYHRTTVAAYANLTAICRDVTVGDSCCNQSVERRSASCQGFPLIINN